MKEQASAVPTRTVRASKSGGASLRLASATTRRASRGRESVMRAMKRRVEALRTSGTEVEYHEYKGLGHGFGPGVGTSAEGWIFEAIRFWETSTRGHSSRPGK